MKNNLENSPIVDDKPLWDVVAGLVGYLGFLVAYDLELFEKLRDDPKSIDEICSDIGIEKRPAEAILSTCQNLGFVKASDSKFELTNVSKTYLLKTSPYYFGFTFDLVIKNYLGYDDIKKAVLANKPTAYGEREVFETHEQQAELAKNFTRFMHSASMASAKSWPENIDLSAYKHILDIGGGSGAHTIGVLLEWENLSGTVIDLPPVCEVCEEYLNQNNLNERAGTLVGDFWECDYPEADLHFYSQIFHDWSIEKCKYLSDKSFNSLPKSGKIIIHEILMNDDKSGPFAASAGSVAMLAWTEGKQYSGQELTEILSSSGFSSIEIIPTFGYWSIVVGTK